MPSRSFQRRWFVLRGNLLFYFEKKTERMGGGSLPPSGVIVLEGCTVELAEEEQEKPFAFKIAFHGEGKRTYVAATESQVCATDKINFIRPLAGTRLLKVGWDVV